MLLEQHSVSEKEKGKTSHSGVMNITPAPTPSCRVAPSKNIFHGSDISTNKMSLSDMSSENFHSSGIG